jgi:ribosomal protein S12 methylthiotransferase
MTKQSRKTYYLVSLGCPKNLVDSESMAELLNLQGLNAADNPENAEFLIVNTCGFLKAAREEAITVLTDLASEKMPWQKLVAAGCMPELHRQEILDAVPGIDGLLGTRRWMDIGEVIQKTQDRRNAIPYQHFPEATKIGLDEKGTLRVAKQGGSAYLKIADGCRRACAFCLIPKIKGTLVSRPINEILEDALVLQEHNVKEIILIAQDITDYGIDLKIENGLISLLESLINTVPNVPWIRLMYTYPGVLIDPLVALMAAEPQILPYLDMPLQHADSAVLRAMHRPHDIDKTLDDLLHIKEVLPEITLRTTFIVGYPGEDDKAFQNLIDFVEKIQFDHVGAFTYSFEHGAPAEPLGDPIPGYIKTERVEHLMQVQGGISLNMNQGFIGKTLPVLIEGVDQENQISIGRSYRDAPEVDGLVVVEGIAPIGELCDVRIKSAITHDLVGDLIK